MSAEKISVLENLKDVVANSEYVGSGDSVGKKYVARYDYFESRVRINDQRYIAKIDVEARMDRKNRVRTYTINNIDLVPLGVSAQVQTPVEQATSNQGLNHTIPNSAPDVNLESKNNTQEVDVMLPTEPNLDRMEAGRDGREISDRLQDYKKRHERNFIARLSETFNIPKAAQADLIPMLSEIGDSVIRSGELGQEDSDMLFEVVYDSATCLRLCRKNWCILPCVTSFLALWLAQIKNQPFGCLKHWLLHILQLLLFLHLLFLQILCASYGFKNLVLSHKVLIRNLFNKQFRVLYDTLVHKVVQRLHLRDFRPVCRRTYIDL